MSDKSANNTQLAELFEKLRQTCGNSCDTCKYDEICTDAMDGFFNLCDVFEGIAKLYKGEEVRGMKFCGEEK